MGPATNLSQGNAFACSNESDRPVLYPDDPRLSTDRFRQDKRVDASYISAIPMDGEDHLLAD